MRGVEYKQRRRRVCSKEAGEDRAGKLRQCGGTEETCGGGAGNSGGRETSVPSETKCRCLSVVQSRAEEGEQREGHGREGDRAYCAC